MGKLVLSLTEPLLYEPQRHGHWQVQTQMSSQGPHSELQSQTWMSAFMAARWRLGLSSSGACGRRTLSTSICTSAACLLSTYACARSCSTCTAASRLWRTPPEDATLDIQAFSCSDFQICRTASSGEGQLSHGRYRNLPVPGESQSPSGMSQSQAHSHPPRAPEAAATPT